jgi:hypothetical protein
MKSRFSLRFGFTVLALALSLTFGGLTALGQTACIDNCLAQLDDCYNQTGGSPVCEDEYDACVEDCLSRQ